MRAGYLTSIVLLLVACTQDVRGMRLSDVDLSDRATVSALGSQLDERERTALLTYVAIHVPGTIGFCGQKLVGERGEEPVTIADAIQLTLARQREIGKSLVLEQATKTEIELVAEQWDRLIDQRELLIHRHSMLLAEHGPAARNLQEWRDIQARIVRHDAELEAVRRKLESAR